MSEKKIRKRREFSQKTTIHDVGREAGVSSITVSRYFRSPERVSESTRKRVEQAVQKLNYVPNRIAGTLASNRSNIVAVIVPNITNSIFAETLQAIEDSLRPSGLHLLIGHSNYSLQTEEDLVRTFLAHRPDGIILTGYTHSENTVEMVRAAGIPVVQIWNITQSPIGVNVGVSSYDAAYTMTRYLIGKGYRNIAYIGGHVTNNDRTVQRESGFLKALDEAGIHFNNNLLQRCNFEFLAGGQALENIMKADPDVEAVFAASDILAVGAMLKCQELNIKIPNDLALAGYDDAGISSLMSPPLTTVAVPRYEIGSQAAQAILKGLNGDPQKPQCIDLGFKIVQRGSA
ncbi:LacI family DNA-binding transcriptional regulator [Aliamphritea hakodatensis]|uniref:LacI family DNA-binding transcriptional regulator n=1 Tax=Aliamphritea hakodatensis TaxID=2895352 RepID=UPI0022FDAD65|nr:LacI family DNA-binding transcriptional regulator [Aliamphritea hakodatensis]